MRSFPSASFLLLTLHACAATAAAQVLTPPPRSEPAAPRRSAPEQNRPEQSLILGLSLLGGYDDNITPNEQGVAADPLRPAESGITGSTTGELQYRYRSQARSLEAIGRTHMTSFRNLGVQPLVGAEVDVDGTTELGSRANLVTSLGARYRPTFLFLPVSGAELATDAATVAPTDPTTGIAEQRWRIFDTHTRLGFNWNAKHNTSVGYGYSQSVVIADDGMNTRFHSASLSHHWEVTRLAWMTFDYQFTTNETETDLEAMLPVDSHSANAGFEIEKRLSATRALLFRAGAGAMQVESDPGEATSVDYIAPSYSGGAQMDLGRTWSLSADVYRTVSMMPGLTLQSFLTDSLSLWLGGEIGRRTTLAMNASYTEGRPHEGQTGSFDGLSSTLQLQYEYARCCTLIGSYSYYSHRLGDLTGIPTGFPNRFERNAVRIGTSIELPIFGSATATGEPVRRGRPTPRGGRPATRGRR